MATPTINKRGDQPLRRRLDDQYKLARFTLLLVLAFTVVNLLMRISQTFVFFLFSANIPFYLLDLGMYYGGIYSNPSPGMLAAGYGSLGAPFFALMLGVAVLFVTAYFVCWLLSANRAIYLKIAFILLAVDTAFMTLTTLFGLADFSIFFLVDLAMHGASLYLMGEGVAAHRRLLALSPTTPSRESAEETA